MRVLAQKARDSGLLPLWDGGPLEEFRRRVRQVRPSVYCEVTFLTGDTHRTVRGDYLSFDGETIVLAANGRNLRVPIRQVIHGTFNVEQQGGDIERHDIAWWDF